MATSRRSYTGQRAGVPADVAGVAPLGTVRRSQLISTYGIGAVVDLEKGTFMPMGLDDWDGVTRSPSLAIHEARLAAQLAVDHFRLPPVSTELRRGQVDVRSSV